MFTHDFIAEEEVSRRKLHSTTTRHMTPAATAVTDPPRTASLDSAVPSSPPLPPAPTQTAAIRPTTVTDLARTAPSAPTIPSPPLLHEEPSSTGGTCGQTQDETPDTTTAQLHPSARNAAPPLLEPAVSDGHCPPSPLVMPSLSPRPRSPMSGVNEITLPLVPPSALDQTTDGQGTVPRVERSSPPPGAFTFSGSSPFITPAAIQYLQTISAGQCWENMIASYLHLEELAKPDGVRHLFRSPLQSYLY